MLITFCSSFFRLAFNKRFFDVARTQGGTDYLLVKSYLSQCVLGVAYAVLGVILIALPNATDVVFVGVYLAAGVGALGYVLYRPPS